MIRCLSVFLNPGAIPMERPIRPVKMGRNSFKQPRKEGNQAVISDIYGASHLELQCSPYFNFFDFEE
jgi:hypothetical protein